MLIHVISLCILDSHLDTYLTGNNLGPWFLTNCQRMWRLLRIASELAIFTRVTYI